jgi:hypothetical protein
MQWAGDRARSFKFGLRQLTIDLIDRVHSGMLAGQSGFGNRREAQGALEATGATPHELAFGVVGVQEARCCARGTLAHAKRIYQCNVH